MSSFLRDLIMFACSSSILLDEQGKTVESHANYLPLAV